ncbi:glucose dehydrogenase [Penicillium verrucosum]|uniref:glucose dehydrogenase n=1 Tax=Penicillium verrucosum TaxID=60171 RepID=UPI0025452777|nr:glucose dehydrogenase [Penicillium verrucosum]KAJ5926674.1 glucose dehydrogenase [Penicillium verrucosum]
MENDNARFSFQADKFPLKARKISARDIKYEWLGVPSTVTIRSSPLTDPPFIYPNFDTDVDRDGLIHGSRWAMQAPLATHTLQD